MVSKSQLVQAAVVTLVVAHDIRTQIQTHKLTRLYIAATEGYEETQQHNKAQIAYLCHMLNKHEVMADEFDFIVLNNLV